MFNRLRCCMTRILNSFAIDTDSRHGTWLDDDGVEESFTANESDDLRRQLRQFTAQDSAQSFGVVGQPLLLQHLRRKRRPSFTETSSKVARRKSADLPISASSSLRHVKKRMGMELEPGERPGRPCRRAGCRRRWIRVHRV